MILYFHIIRKGEDNEKENLILLWARLSNGLARGLWGSSASRTSY
jgi:hypothetical protein